MMKTLLALLLSLFAATSLHASVTYRYTSAYFNQFSYVDSPGVIDPMTVFTNQDRLIFELTLSEALGPVSSLEILSSVLGPVVHHNHEVAPSPITPLSWKFYAGPVNFSGNFGDEYPALFIQFYLRTDVNGNISEWQNRAFRPPLDDPYWPGTIFSSVDDYIRSYHSTMPSIGTDFVASCQADAACLQRHSYPIGAADSNPSYWTITYDETPASVPEPSSLLLLGAALTGVAVSVRRKKARLCA